MKRAAKILTCLWLVLLADGAFAQTTWTKLNNVIPSASDTTSTDGRIPLGNNGRGDDYHTYPGSVIRVGSTYYLWYAGNDQTYPRMYLATSSNGLVWAKYNNVIPSASDTTSTDGRLPLRTAGKGDDNQIMRARVVRNGDSYWMWY